jgi:protein transport protein HofC
MGRTQQMKNKYYLFRWQSLDERGMLQNGEDIANDRRQIVKQLFNNQQIPLKIKIQRRLYTSDWKKPELIALITQLASLLHAGLPLVQSLTLLSKQHVNPVWRCVLNMLMSQVKEGIPLSEALKRHPYAFPDIFQQIITIGELTGKLEVCCQQLAEHQEKQWKLYSKIRKTLRYPLFISLMAIVVTLSMLLFVLPEFAAIYASFNASLPWFTQSLLTIASILAHHGPYFLVLLFTLTFSYYRICHPQPQWQWREQHLLLRLPWITKLITATNLSQIFQTLAMTQQAGMPLFQGLNTSRLSITNLHFQHAISDAMEKLNQGIPLYQAINSSPLFTPLCQQIVRIGEESGTLEELLAKLAHWHHQQANSLADSLIQAIEPIMMIIMGIIIGGLVIAMYLPIFQLGNVID